MATPPGASTSRRIIKSGADNVLAIRLDNPPDSSRWYPGGGIYRNVWLVKTAPVHIAHWGTYVTTPDGRPTQRRPSKSRSRWTTTPDSRRQLTVNDGDF